MESSEEKDYYINSNGLLVFTSYYLRKRGYCCGNGCKHCPYDYQNVPEPGKTRLLKIRADEPESKQR